MEPSTPSTAAWACSGLPEWTIRELSLVSRRLRCTSAKCWVRDESAFQAQFINGRCCAAEQGLKAQGRSSVARDYYALLGVGRNASDSDIKRAYRKLARELHPDVNPDEVAQAKFKEISVAYEVLSDPEKRRIVDMGGDPLANAASGANGFAGFGGLGDVFEAFFGGGATSRGPIGRVRPGSDSLLRMRLDLTECATGVNKQVTVDTAVLCDRCQGRGTNGNSAPIACDTCGGRGEVQTVQRSLLGQVMTARPSPTECGSGSTPKVRSALAEDRQATSPSRFTNSRTTSSSATATICTARSRCRWSTR